MSMMLNSRITCFHNDMIVRCDEKKVKAYSSFLGAWFAQVSQSVQKYGLTVCKAFGTIGAS